MSGETSFDLFDIFGESSDEEEDFYGFTNEELGINSDVNVSDGSASDREISDSDEEDIDHHRCRPNEEQELQGQLIWTRTLTSTLIEPYAEVNTGPVNILPEESKELDFLNLMFPPVIYEILARETNLYARQKIEEKGKEDKRWFKTNTEEIKAYNGLRIFMSIVNLPNFKMYWSKDFAFGNFFPAKVIPRGRFESCASICMQTTEQKNELDTNGRPKDRVYLITPIIDLVQEACKKNYIPPRDVTIDEVMIAFRGRFGFRQYMPAKPTKYGIKVWQLSVSENGYCSNFSIYLGKPLQGKKEADLGKKVVLDMVRNLGGKYNHLYFDNYFNSVGLLEEWLEKTLYGCGTMRSNRSSLPAELRPKTKNNAQKNLRKTIKEELKESGDSVVFQKGAVTALAWLEKPKRKPVLIAATNSLPDCAADSVQRKQKNGELAEVPCPRPVKDYNGKMNGVDRTDQMRTEYTTTRMSKGGELKFFSSC